MRNTHSKSFAALVTGMLALTSTAAFAAGDAALDKSAMAALDQCQAVSASCAATTKDAVGVLVFPSVVKADLLVGGAGGKGALIENGKVTGYYNIGALSAGLQAGISEASQVYAFRTTEALNKLKQGQDWKIGASAGVTLVTADANARGVADTKSNVFAYIFDSKGLNAGMSVDLFSVWKDGMDRPKS